MEWPFCHINKKAPILKKIIIGGQDAQMINKNKNILWIYVQ